MRVRDPELRRHSEWNPLAEVVSTSVPCRVALFVAASICMVRTVAILDQHSELLSPNMAYLSLFVSVVMFVGSIASAEFSLLVARLFGLYLMLAVPLQAILQHPAPGFLWVALQFTYGFLLIRLAMAASRRAA